MLTMPGLLRFASSLTHEATLKKICWMRSWEGTKVLLSMPGMMPPSRRTTGSAWRKLNRATKRKKCSKLDDLGWDFCLSSTSQVISYCLFQLLGCTSHESHLMPGIKQWHAIVMLLSLHVGIAVVSWHSTWILISNKNGNGYPYFTTLKNLDIVCCS